MSPGSASWPEVQFGGRRIVPYTESLAEVWDNFVAQSRNGTFIHTRRYLTHARDRFIDRSLLVYDEEGLLAVLPANQEGSMMVSHRGLTYGGLITDGRATTVPLFGVFDALSEYLWSRGMTHLLYRSIPHIYHRVPAEEDLYILTCRGARLLWRHLLSIVDRRHRLPIGPRRRRGTRKADRAGVTVRTTSDFESFWNVLEEMLRERYSVKPVHDRHEILRLKELFPDQIILHGAYQADTLLGGCVIYDTGQVARVQYVASGERGRALGALDLLFETLVQKDYADRPYFDFGSSAQDTGLGINEGLVCQKEGFGARAVVQDFYEYDLRKVYR